MTKTLLFLTLMLVAAVSGCDVNVNGKTETLHMNPEQYTREHAGVTCSITTVGDIYAPKEECEGGYYVNGQRVRFECATVYLCSDGMYLIGDKNEILLLLALLLIAPVAGADCYLASGITIQENYHCSCKDRYMTCEYLKDQPAEEAKPEVLTESEASERLDRTGNLSDTIIVKDNCPKIDCGLNNPSGKMCTFDKNGCAVYVEQSDAEKWKQDCDRFIKLYETTNHTTYLDKADIYCTRAILEEMRNK